MTKADDILRLRIPTAVASFPDGERVLWVERRTDAESGKTLSSLMIGRPGAAPRPFTTGRFSDASPRISPDGAWVLFTRSDPFDKAEGPKKQQVCLIATDGGEARTILAEAGAFAEVVWSPDSTRVCVSFRRADPLPEGMDGPVAIRVTRLWYKEDGIGYLPQDRFSLYLVDPFADTPALQPLTDIDGDWDDLGQRWSPDGTTIAFRSNRRGDRDRTAELTELYVVPADGGGARRITDGDWCLLRHAWAPSGRWIAAVGCPGPQGTAFFREDIGVYRFDPTGAPAPTNLTAALDRSTANMTIDDLFGIADWSSGPQFDPAGDHVYFPVCDEGVTWLGRLPVTPDGAPEGPIQRLTTDEVVLTFAVARDAERLSAVLSSPTEPCRVVTLSTKGTGAESIAWPLEPWVRSAELIEPIELRAPSPDGNEVHGWMLLPTGPGPHPMLLSIHGGPIVQYGRACMHELQYLVSCGYAILFANPRGSLGYGASLTRQIHRNWGAPAHTDLMAITDAALAAHPIDPERLGVFGGSYGGYMTNWMCGHTDRFKAAVTQRTVSDMMGLLWGDFGAALGDGLGEWPWESREIYDRLSPITYAENIETPMLVMQGLDDLRTPWDQGERLYMTLRLMGKTAEMVLFPGASHGLSRSGPAKQRLARLEAIREWFDRWL